MKNSFLIGLSLSSILVCGSLSDIKAQDTTKVANLSLTSQYNEMLSKTRTLDGYKLVNPTRLTNLWRSATDSLKREQRKLRQAEAKLNTLTTSVGTLKKTLTTNEEALAASTLKLDQVSFLGMPVDKSTYNLIMWGAVLLLGIALFVSVFQSTSARKEARYRVKLFEELSTEFQTYKVKANEREKKLARELQDERNKLDDLGHRD
ncbi:: hypothetical protein [Arcticibacter svalbardensis MN12-7]|uniref:Uncharacterized protein n=1 Tax=Arcticibacter svalbardensis MN12-7 TaxID=1150600 RepID=R9GMQ8_9SPHI|nr:hypothetical protein [Arcticibacter svalbardensis]EOR92825.1 : hypothetical protein [Arcticibacter svalbardensis MN12-7]